MENKGPGQKKGQMFDLCEDLILKRSYHLWPGLKQAPHCLSFDTTNQEVAVGGEDGIAWMLRVDAASSALIPRAKVDESSTQNREGKKRGGRRYEEDVETEKVMCSPCADGAKDHAESRSCL
eukprot:673583-Rhodomonas_salina.2